MPAYQRLLTIIFRFEIPPSGLDAFQSETTIKSLKELARAGHTVVISIHQVRKMT